MSDDFEIEKGVGIGDWLYKKLEEEVHFENEPYWMDRVRRVELRLQECRPQTERFRVEVPWISEVTAFTAPGRYIYVTRRLLEQFPEDEPVAFVVAHEIAHHDLGHTRLFASWAVRMSLIPAAGLFALAFHAMERRLYGPEKECDADRCGLDLCVKAGYNPQCCLKLFNVLEERALYLGDLDIVYGPGPDSDEELSPDASLKTRIKIWAWQRTRGYLPIQDRRKALLNHLKAAH